MMDYEYLEIEETFNRWLSFSNFNEYGEQIHHLKDFHKILESKVIKDKNV